MMIPVGLRLMMFMACVVLKVVNGEQQTRCIPKEREALLQFKAAIVDRYYMLSSWTTPDCCQWEGIRCSNLTAHVLGLHLPGQFDDESVLDFDSYISYRYISGEIHESLMKLRQLEYLNLSFNSFEDIHIPEFLASLTNMKYLDLSSCRFGGEIPTQFGSLSHLRYLNLGQNSLEGSIPCQLGNLSQLQYLDLGHNSFEGDGIKIDDGGQWLSNLISLTHLYFDSVSNLNRSHSWLQVIAKLPKLRELSLVDCSLSDHFIMSSKPFHFNSSTSLSVLHLSFNTFTSPMVFHWVSNITSNLVELNLYGNLLEGFTSSDFGMVMNSLRHLDLSSNYFKARDLKSFTNICTLSSLNLYQNNLIEDLSSILDHLSSGCVRHSLQELDLSNNHIIGTLSEFSVLSSLKALVLDHNHLSGKIPQDIILPPQLESLSIQLNSFEGGIPKSFGNACALRSLDISSNNLNEEFSLIIHHLSGCARNSLQEMNLSGNKINGTLSDLSVFLALKKLDIAINQLSGKISEASKLPSSLEYLSIQQNSFEGGIPKSFGNACALRSLDISSNNLNEEFSLIIHHLSGCARNSLQELDLSINKINGTLSDLSVFLALKKLDLGGNQLSGKISEASKLPSSLEYLSTQWNSFEGGIPKSFGNACALRSLDISYNSLNEEFSVIIHHLSGWARNSLQKLSLSRNKINGTLPDLSVFLTLKNLDLTENQLSGKISEGSKFPSSLEYLFTGLNNFEGGIPNSLGNACALRSLDMSKNNLSEEFPKIIHHLSGCARYSLEKLDLGMNQINGTLPDFSTFTSLKELYLDENKLNGEIPKDIQFPQQLEKLYMESNSLKGVLNNYHFANMSKLQDLYLSDNSLALSFTENWVPPFRLLTINLRSCKLGPTFPKWLQTQNKFDIIDISNASISDIVPEWFWAKLPLSNDWLSMNISYNNLQGLIPNFPEKNHFYEMSLGSNQFEGPIPLFFRNVVHLDLSKNKFSNFILFLCSDGTSETLNQLDLSHNQLSGQIPDCWSHFKSLAYLDMSHNKFSGKVPSSLGSLFDLQALLLRNNNLTNEIPLSLRSCTKLVILDLAENKLTGPFPSWIGSNLIKLRFLSLGSNNFYGTLPIQICYLKNILLLDLSINNLFGQIPKCINFFVAMGQKVSGDYDEIQYNFDVGVFGGRGSYKLNEVFMWKGSKQMFMNNGLSLLRSIDLSSNHFLEEIPVEIEDLLELVSLNLSRNNLMGKIPSNIGKLASLEFLDLSRNQLVGSIPTSLTQIDRLSMLDLSHNYLTGEIPISTQLQSFNSSSYEDNLDLCGLPLEKLCIKEEPTNAEVYEDEYSFFNNDFFISMAFGFVVSFWMVFGSILFKRSWRHAYFNFLNNLADNVHIKVAAFVKLLTVDKN